MKLLYLVHKVELPIQQHIIDFLRSKNIIVDVEIIGPSKPGQVDVWQKIKSSEYINNINKVGYDYIVSNTHSQYIDSFFNRARPKHSFIDIEHDLFNDKPEHALKNTVVFTLQDRHADYCANKGIKYVRCQSPKLHIDITADSYGFNRWKSLVLIGTGAFNSMINSGKKFSIDGFPNIWYKKYLDNWKHPKGTKPLPAEFNEPIGMLHCAKHFNFIMTIRSSCFVEALLLGCIPIILPNHLVSERRINEILSEVRIERFNYNFKAITVPKLKYKLDLLEKDPPLFRRTRQIMLNDWVNSDYFELPGVHEAIFNFIKEKL